MAGRGGVERPRRRSRGWPLTARALLSAEITY